MRSVSLQDKPGISLPKMNLGLPGHLLFCLGAEKHLSRGKAELPPPVQLNKLSLAFFCLFWLHSYPAKDGMAKTWPGTFPFATGQGYSLDLRSNGS